MQTTYDDRAYLGTKHNVGVFEQEEAIFYGN